MHYPWWYIPCLTSPMLIAVVAVIHVLVSHYAVGGGILLALENGYGHRKKDEAYRNYWKRHAAFFILLTVVFGAVTGVGIWWTIGLASPLATELLIRTFVFGWGIEWCFFVMELVAAFGFYYFWSRLSPRLHSVFGWIYALAAWISLVLITGITSFMLNSRTLLGQLDLTADPSAIGTFWQSFLNPQFIPQTVLRTGGALILATFYVYLHVSLTENNEKVREQVVRRMRIPSVVGLVLLVIGVVGWFWFLPASSRAMLERAAAMNIFAGLFAAIIAGILVLLWVGPFRNPKKMATGIALALFLFGLAGIGVAEFIREAVRKPFIVDRLVYGNQIGVNEVESIRRLGILESGVWPRLYMEKMQEKYPEFQVVSPRPTPAGPSPSQELPTLAPESSGRVIPIPGTLDLAAQNEHVIRQTQLRLTVDSQQANPSRPVGQPRPLDESPNFQPTALPTRTEAPPAEAPRSVAESTPLPGDPGESADGSSEPDVQPKAMVRPIDQEIMAGNPNLLRLSEEDRLAVGQVVFMYHCNDCHAARLGYSAVGPMLTGKSRQEIIEFVTHLNRPGYYMPPWCGTKVEAELLADFLLTVRPEMPHNLETDLP